MNWNKIWQLVKPVIIATLAGLGILFPNSFFFTAILALSLLFRGASIIAGFKEIIRYIKSGEDEEEALGKHVGPRPPKPPTGG